MTNKAVDTGLDAGVPYNSCTLGAVSVGLIFSGFGTLNPPHFLGVMCGDALGEADAMGRGSAKVALGNLGSGRGNGDDRVINGVVRRGDAGGVTVIRGIWSVG